MCRASTPSWPAPLLRSHTAFWQVEFSVDIYSFGVLMWELFTSHPVYLGLNSNQIRQQVRPRAACLHPHDAATLPDMLSSHHNMCMIDWPQAGRRSGAVVQWCSTP